jgi:hypothetical protein
MASNHNLGPAMFDANSAAAPAIATSVSAAYYKCFNAVAAATTAYQAGGPYATFAAAVKSAEATRAAALDPGAVVAY